MTQQLLTIASALIPGSLMVWFLAAIASKIFTRCQMARRQPQLVKVERVIVTAAPIYLESLPVPPFASSEVAKGGNSPNCFNTLREHEP